MYPSRIEEFIELAQKGNLVPVYEEYSAALETPLSVFLKIRRGSYGFLLESVERGQSLGRYSFIGSEPYLLFSSKDGRVRTSEKGKTVDYVAQDPLQELEKLLKRYQPVRVPGLPSFTGGAVGYLGYDMARYFEKLPPGKKEEPDLPECMFMFTDTLVIFDHVRQVIQVVVNARVTDNPHQDYHEAVKKIELIRAKLNAVIPDYQLSNTAKPQKNLKYSYNLTSEQFQEMVKEAKRYIWKGDIFQVVLSQRISFQLETDSLEIYRVLRSLNPSPYMFYLQLDDLYFVGSSPEVLVKVENGKAEIRPIAGTRPRGKDEFQECNLEQELLGDEKERAEHLMLVDLGRNDLGRVSKYGTVKVENFMEVEKYSHVMHLVSKVTGTLLPHFNCLDVFRACFPAGTVSGAPKIRAMEIIDALEPTPRGPYAGAVGYITYGGDMDTCITIRTLVVKKDTGYIQAGAGIVADSDPLKEYQETLNKAKALLKAVEMAERGGAYVTRHR
ncbi:MAG: anthranilate synthase component I [Bacillota bacterium]